MAAVEPRSPRRRPDYFALGGTAGLAAAVCRLWRCADFPADAMRWGFFFTAADLPVTAAAGADGAVAGAGAVAAEAGPASTTALSRERTNRLISFDLLRRVDTRESREGYGEPLTSSRVRPASPPARRSVALRPPARE